MSPEQVAEIENDKDVKAVFLASEDLKLAATLLYQAYHDDPLFTDIFNAEKDGYEQRLRAAIREELNTFWEADQPMVGLFHEQRMLGVACLIAPDASFGSGRFWHWRLKMLLTAGYFSTKQMLEKEEKIQAAMPVDKYHMLAFIAVHPLHQHHGLGHYLMAAVDSVLQDSKDSQGVGVYVTLDKNMPFFEDGHYQLVQNLQVGNISGNLMFRAKQGMS